MNSIVRESSILQQPAAPDRSITTLDGHTDMVSHEMIAGWARDSSAPDERTSLIVTVNGEIQGRFLANRYREDLKRAGIGDGKFAFEFRFAGRLSALIRHEVVVLRESDGAMLGGRSSAVLEPASAFDQSARATLASLLASVGDDADFESRQLFLAEQTERLRQLRAGRQSGLAEREQRRQHRWAGPAPAGENPAPPPPLRSRALVIDEDAPVLGRDAGSNAIFSHILSLQRIGFDVSFVAANLRDSADLEAAGIDCCAKPWYGSVEEMLIRQRDSFNLVYLHRAGCATRYAPLVRHHQPKAFVIYSVADLHFLRIARQAEIEERPELKVLSQKTETAEMMAAWNANAVITHSSFECELLRKRLPAEKVHVVPWAVPYRPVKTPFAERRGIAFIGGYGRKPNIDAARWLIEAVMPELVKLDPSIPCLLVGSNMPDVLRRIAREPVEAVGAVEDLADIFNRIRLTAAPLAFGAGIKGKVLESLAAGIPCMCTPIAAEGLNLPPLLGQLVASEPAAFAAGIKRLHDDAVFNQRCAAAGLGYIAAEASEARIDALMRNAIGVLPKVA